MQKKNQGKNKRRTQNQDNGKAAPASQQRAFGEQARPSKKTDGNNQPYAKEDDQSTEHLSEAARHQAMPQTPIYAADLNIGRRHDARRNPKTTHHTRTTRDKKNTGARFNGNANKGR